MKIGFGLVNHDDYADRWEFAFYIPLLLCDLRESHPDRSVIGLEFPTDIRWSAEVGCQWDFVFRVFGFGFSIERQYGY